MAHVTFADSSVTVSTTARSLIADATSGIPTQTTDGRLEGAVVRATSTAAGDQFLVQVLGASSEVLWQETRYGAWSSPVVIPAIMLPAAGWDIVATKLAGTDRVLGVEGAVEDGTSSGGATAADVADAVWDEAKAGHVASGSFGEGVTVNSLAASVITAASLAADAGTEIAAAVWANVLEGAHTAADMARLTVSRLLGKATIQATDGAYTYRDLGDTKNRIVGAVSGTARTISTVDGT